MYALCNLNTWSNGFSKWFMFRALLQLVLNLMGLFTDKASSRPVGWSKVYCCYYRPVWWKVYRQESSQTSLVKGLQIGVITDQFGERFTDRSHHRPVWWKVYRQESPQTSLVKVYRQKSLQTSLVKGLQTGVTTDQFGERFTDRSHHRPVWSKVYGQKSPQTSLVRDYRQGLPQTCGVTRSVQNLDFKVVMPQQRC